VESPPPLPKAIARRLGLSGCRGAARDGGWRLVNADPARDLSRDSAPCRGHLLHAASMDEASLLEKLRLIEALYAGATTEGERVAAGEARRRIQLRLEAMEAADPPIEHRFSLADAWSQKLFVALCRRYGIKPYRYRGQRRTTLMAKVSRSFVRETLWPEFEQLSRVLRKYLDEATERIIAAAIHQDVSDASEVAGAAQIAAAAGGNTTAAESE
jgi:hypothetical protein